MFADFSDSRRLLVRFDILPDKLINSSLFGGYRHWSSLFPFSAPHAKMNFHLTAENLPNILEQMRRDVKSFLSHRGFSPVILLRRLTSSGISRIVSDGWP